MTCLRVISALLLMPLLGHAAPRAAEISREQAIADAVSFAARELENSRQPFNIVVPDNKPFFPIVVASLGTPRRTFLATSENSCEIRGEPFADPLYTPTKYARVNIADDAGARNLIRAFLAAGESTCVAAVRRCRNAGDIDTCVTIVRGSGVGGIVADSRDASRLVKQLDPTVLLSTADSYERHIALVATAILSAPPAEIVGFGPIGATTRDALAWRYYLPTSDLGSSTSIALLPPSEAARMLNVPRGAGFPIVMEGRSGGISEADIERIYETAGFHNAEWRESLRVHPAIALRNSHDESD